MAPALLQLTCIEDVLEWYERNLCQIRLIEPRGFRVRFLSENFIHLIQLKNKYGEEPRNARLALEEIRRGNIAFVDGRYDRQRTSELAWATDLAINPDKICANWQVLGRGDEAYIKDFGTPANPKYRVMVCEVIGTIRQVVTIFPRKKIGLVELQAQLWP